MVPLCLSASTILSTHCFKNTVEKRLVYSSAGLNEAPLLINANGEANEINISGFPICRLKDIFAVTYSEFDLPVKSGDRLYLYTDGLVEARNIEKQQYSSIKLKQLLQRYCNKSLIEQTTILTEDLIHFSAGEKLNDDVTLLAVNFK
jgi:sigma-B regulation protein RsbU (phosphoserine phosphatase)